jgi:hypothetical protein
LAQILTTDEIRYFASIEIRNTEGRWSAFHNGDFVPYSKVSDSDKEFVDDDLHYIHTTIRQKLNADPAISAYAKYLLIIPSQEQIFVYHDEDGLPKVTLAQWGFSLPRDGLGFDPLGLIMEERKKTHTLVTVAVKWTDNEPVDNKEFKFKYKYSDIKKTTNKDGLMKLGLLKNGTQFTITDPIDPELCTETFEVIADQTLYNIVIPFYTSVEIKVVDQLDMPVPGSNIKMQHGDESSTFTTNDKGEFKIDKILFDNNPLTLFLLPECKINKEYRLNRKPNKIVLKIYRSITQDVQITVVNKADNKPVPDHPIKVKFDNIEKKLSSPPLWGGAGGEVITDIDGIVTLSEIEINTKITVTDSNDQYNYKDFTVDINNHEFVFPVEFPETISATIKAVNKKNNTPVRAYPLKVKIGNIEQELYTNSEGIIALNDIEQTGTIRVTDGKDPFNNAEFTIDANNSEYIFPIVFPEALNPHIKVVNKADNTILEAYPLKITIDDNEQTMYSNREGIVLLDPMEKNKTITVVDGNNPYNNAEYTTDPDTDEFVFLVELPTEKTVKIKLIDLNKNIMPNRPLDIIINGVVYQKTTDDEGRVSLPASLFTHGKKVKIQVPIIENDQKVKEKKQRK